MHFQCIFPGSPIFDSFKHIDTPPTILLELAEGGDVSDLFVGTVDRPTQWRLAKEIAEVPPWPGTGALQAAGLCVPFSLQGMDCLHNQVPFPYAHRDLKGAPSTSGLGDGWGWGRVLPLLPPLASGMNIFLTKDYHAKLADFDFLIEIPEGVLVSGFSLFLATIRRDLTASRFPHHKNICTS